MVWSLSDIIALITLIIGIPTSCIGVWTLLLHLKAWNWSAYRKIYPGRESPTPTQELEIVPLQEDTTRTPSPHPRIPTTFQLPESPHDIESLNEYQYVMRESSIPGTIPKFAHS
ncbi:hypothetical protein BDV09DRAFT_25286 [Aspergillus tetrazonus]